MKTKRLITLALGFAMLGSPVYLAAQDQESVADAARRAQAEKKNAPKSKMIINDDNLNTLTGSISIVGPEPTPPKDAANKAATDEKTSKTVTPGEKLSVKDETYWRGKFAEANKKLTDDAHELDIDQREFNLKQEQFYTDPMAALKQEYSRQDLNDSKTKIDEKTAAVEQDKTDISNLEDDMRKAGGDPGWATPPAPKP